MYIKPCRSQRLPVRSLLYVLNVLEGSTATKIKKALKSILMGSVIFLVTFIVIGITILIMLIDNISR